MLTIPTALILIVLGMPLIGVVYQSGHFNSYDTAQTGLALSGYAAGLVGFAAQRMLNPAFFALSDARTPMLVSLSSIAVYILFPLLLLRVWHVGFGALALTSALAVFMECLLLAECLRRKLGGLEGRYLLNSFLRIAGASAVMFFPLAFLHSHLSTLLTQTRLGYAAELAISLPLALALFFAAARAGSGGDPFCLPIFCRTHLDSSSALSPAGAAAC